MCRFPLPAPLTVTLDVTMLWWDTRHLHLHIISDEFRGEYMKNKKHLNSFHPRLGFFLHIDEVLSWFEPDVAPTWFAMVRLRCACMRCEARLYSPATRVLTRICRC